MFTNTTYPGQKQGSKKAFARPILTGYFLFRGDEVNGDASLEFGAAEAVIGDSKQDPSVIKNCLGLGIAEEVFLELRIGAGTGIRFTQSKPLELPTRTSRCSEEEQPYCLIVVLTVSAMSVMVSASCLRIIQRSRWLTAP